MTTEARLGVDWRPERRSLAASALALTAESQRRSWRDDGRGHIAHGGCPALARRHHRPGTARVWHRAIGFKAPARGRIAVARAGTFWKKVQKRRAACAAQLFKAPWHTPRLPPAEAGEPSLQYAADKSLDRQGLLSTNRSEDTALVITTPRSSTRSFTDDLAPGLSTKDRAHWDRGLDPGPERQHARYYQDPKARSHTIDRTEHQVHRRFQAGFRLRGVQS